MYCIIKNTKGAFLAKAQRRTEADRNDHMWIKRESLTENDGLPVFVKSFNAEKGLKNCSLKITATGIFDVNINGHEIPDRFMPGWSNYFRHIDLCRYDITERIIPGGKNTLRITVANGWYSGKLGYGNKTNVFGDRKKIVCRAYS